MVTMIESIDKVFGHLVVEVNVSEERIRTYFKSMQEPRFVEIIIRNRKYYEVPFITSRICGACSIAHFLASIYGIENAMGIEVNEDIKLLRDIMNQVQIAQNNIVHLLFLALPDYIGGTSFKDLLKYNPDIVRIGLKLNALCLKVIDIVAGRIVNPNTCNIGGFYRDIPKEKIKKSIEILREAESLAKKFVDFVFQLETPKFIESSSTYAVLESPREYLVKGEHIVFSNGVRVNSEDYMKVLNEIPTEYSTSKIVLYNGEPLYVGSRARVNAYYERLHGFEEYIEMLSLPLRNPFDNLKAKALEILYIIKNVKEKFDEILDKRLKLRVNVKPREGEGVGVIEAPRGLLIHHYRVDREGRIVYANIITPTTINAKHIEECAATLVFNSMKKGNYDFENLRKLVSMLVRSYDPCLPCATHIVFVKR